MRRRAIAVAAVAGSLLVGGATGAALFGPVLAGAQTTTTTPDNQNGTSFKSNEDATHEANETPEQEAAEDSGTFRGHGHGPNEDPAHEAKETPEREAAEHAGNGAGGTAPSTAPSSGTGSAAKAVFRS